MSNTRPHVLFFGMEGAFSAIVLKKLLAQRIEVSAMVIPVSALASKSGPPIQLRELLPQRRTLLPVLSAIPGLLQQAQREQIPVWEVKKLAVPETLAVLGEYQADMICVACFSRRIPAALLRMVRLGGLNLHPSLLPENRGPVPLFWSFREGHEFTGVSVHELVEEWDSGDILGQVRYPVPEGSRYNELERRAAEQGGELLAQTIWQMWRGEAVRVGQSEGKGSYHSFPEVEDFWVQVEKWGARHIYNFIQGVGLWGGPVMLQSGEQRLPVVRAISYSFEKQKEVLIEEKRWVGYQEGRAWVRCLDGYVQVELM